MESRYSTDPRTSIKLRTARIVKHRNRTDCLYATTHRHRPVSGFVTILLVSTQVTIVLTEIYNLKEESELFNRLKEKFNGNVESYERDISKCAEQTGATIDDRTKFLRNQPQDTKQGRCFLACIMKKIGIMKNSEIDMESYMNMNRKVYAEDVEIMDHLNLAMGECLKLSKGFDECEHASFFNDCMHLRTNHILKRVRREKQKEARVPTKQAPKERAKKVIKDEI